MDLLHYILEIIILAISGGGVLVVVWGVLEAVAAFIALKFSAAAKNAVAESEGIRQRLGAHLLLGLEVFIAADIISSVVSPSWERVGILAAIVAVRTVLSYFLRMELKQGVR